MFYILTNDQIADIFTNALGRKKFVKLKSEMGIRDSTLLSDS